LHLPPINLVVCQGPGSFPEEGRDASSWGRLRA